MSDRVGAVGIRENIACPHFVTQTKRQKVADCRASGWTSEARQASGLAPEALKSFLVPSFFKKKAE